MLLEWFIIGRRLYVWYSLLCWLRWWRVSRKWDFLSVVNPRYSSDVDQLRDFRWRFTRRASVLPKINGGVWSKICPLPTTEISVFKKRDWNEMVAEFGECDTPPPPAPPCGVAAHAIWHSVRNPFGNDFSRVGNGLTERWFQLARYVVYTF